MRISLKTTNFKASNATKALVDDKLVEPVNKLLKSQDRKENLIFDIELARTTKHHKEGKIWKCEVNLNLSGRTKVLRAVTIGESLEEAVNLVKYEITREIKKYKDKGTTKNRKEARRAKLTE